MSLTESSDSLSISPWSVPRTRPLGFGAFGRIPLGPLVAGGPATTAMTARQAMIVIPARDWPAANRRRFRPRSLMPTASRPACPWHRHQRDVIPGALINERPTK